VISGVTDLWDHTLQTGKDGEYTLVLLALCVGVVFALARLIVTLSACLSEASVIFPFWLRQWFANFFDPSPQIASCFGKSPT
jgi:hypothetical protein